MLEQIINQFWKGIKSVGKVVVPLVYLANCEGGIPVNLGTEDVAEDLLCSFNMSPQLTAIGFIDKEKDNGEFVQEIHYDFEDDSCENNHKILMRSVVDGNKSKWERYDDGSSYFVDRECTLGGYLTSEMYIETPAIFGGEDMYFQVKMVDNCKTEGNTISVYRMEEELNDDTTEETNF